MDSNLFLLRLDSIQLIFPNTKCAYQEQPKPSNMYKKFIFINFFTTSSLQTYLSSQNRLVSKGLITDFSMILYFSLLKLSDPSNIHNLEECYHIINTFFHNIHTCCIVWLKLTETLLWWGHTTIKCHYQKSNIVSCYFDVERKM